MTDQPVSIKTEYITLSAFLKWAGVVSTGGHAKALISSGEVLVNGDVERRRGRKLRSGDTVAIPQVGRWAIQQEEA